jgi:hypothetical protein
MCKCKLVREEESAPPEIRGWSTIFCLWTDETDVDGLFPVLDRHGSGLWGAGENTFLSIFGNPFALRSVPVDGNKILEARNNAV